MSVFTNLFRKLTDAYTKNPNSNVGKLIVIMSEGIDDLNDTLKTVEAWRDINQAQGTTLDLIGENVGQERGQANDEIMRILIRARVARNLSDGTFDGVIKALAVTLNTTSENIKIQELYDDIDAPEPAAIAITGLPLDVLNASGLSAGQFGLITQRVIAAGTRVAVIELEGTFSFASGEMVEGGTATSNFVGKVPNETDVNPHIFMAVGNGTGLYTPTSFIYTPSITDHLNISTLNGGVYSAGASSDGKQPQHLFSFNLIEHVERNYGPIPAATTADKVAWLKANINKLTGNWWGFGTSPSGNRANLVAWTPSNAQAFPRNEWRVAEKMTTTAGTPTKLSYVLGDVTEPLWHSNPANAIDSNGFVHFLAYAEPSNGTVSSVINTDYVELIVEMKPSPEGFANIAGTTGGTLSGLLVNDDIDLPI